MIPFPLFDNAYLIRLYAGKRKNIPKIISAYVERIRRVVQLNQVDLVWIEKELLPWGPLWLEQYLKWQHIPYVVDYDDAIFHQYDLNPHDGVRWLIGKKIDKIMRKARLVTVGNQYLAKRARVAGAGWVERIPTVIDLARYPIPPARRPKLPFIIGWMGSPTTAVYLKEIEPALVEFCRSHDARLVVIGAENPHLSPKIPVKSIPWSEDSEAASIARFDVGIMPLPGTPWARGKCGYKSIQYMACQKPVIASRISAELDIIQEGKTGFIVDSTKQWIDRLNTLYTDRQLALQMGKRGRHLVATRYCLQVTTPRLKSLLMQAARY